MDEILCYLLAGGQARAYVAKTEALCERAMRTHTLSHVATAALGRTLTCAAMMGVQMKNAEDRLTVTVKGNGPLGSLTVTAKNDGSVKGFVQHPDVELPLRQDGKLDVGGAVGHKGRLTVVRDTGLKEPYVGNIDLRTGEIAEDFAYYFLLSEQQPSAVALGVLLDHGRVTGAGGVMLQPMPGCGEETLRFLEHSAPLIMDVSSLFYENSAAQVGEILFAPIAHTLEASYIPRFRCDCGREKIARLIAGLGRAEIASMMREQHGAEVVCQFCNKKYNFTEDELAAMLCAREGAH